MGRGSKEGSGPGAGGGFFRDPTFGKGILSRLYKIYVIRNVVTNHCGGVIN